MNHFVALALASAACATNFSSRRAQTSLGCGQESSERRKGYKRLGDLFSGFLKESFVVEFLLKAVKIGLETMHGVKML